MRAINEMMVTAPNDGSFIHLFPYFPANVRERSIHHAAHEGWLASIGKQGSSKATTAELATAGSRGVVSGVEIARDSRRHGAAGQSLGGAGASWGCGVPACACVSCRASRARTWAGGAGVDDGGGTGLQDFARLKQ